MKGNSFCLNALIVSEFLTLGSRWNHSSSEAGKKKRFKIRCSTVVTWNVDIIVVKIAFWAKMENEAEPRSR